MSGRSLLGGVPGLGEPPGRVAVAEEHVGQRVAGLLPGVRGPQHRRHRVAAPSRWWSGSCSRAPSPSAGSPRRPPRRGGAGRCARSRLGRSWSSRPLMNGMLPTTTTTASAPSAACCASARPSRTTSFSKRAAWSAVAAPSASVPSVGDRQVVVRPGPVVRLLVADVADHVRAVGLLLELELLLHEPAVGLGLVVAERAPVVADVLVVGGVAQGDHALAPVEDVELGCRACVGAVGGEDGTLRAGPAGDVLAGADLAQGDPVDALADPDRGAVAEALAHAVGRGHLVGQRAGVPVGVERVGERADDGDRPVRGGVQRQGRRRSPAAPSPRPRPRGPARGARGCR